MGRCFSKATSKYQQPSVLEPDFSPYECLICLEYIVPPYLQCTNGHMICNECLSQVCECPVCKGPKPSVRNRMLEGIVEPFLLLCQFKDEGCKQKFLTTKRQIKHEKKCQFQPISVLHLFKSCFPKIAPKYQPHSVLDVDFSLYECQICSEYMVPPYLQCTNGHMICNECLSKVCECPVCKGPKPSVRNRVLESIVEPFLIWCQYENCEQKFLTTKRQIKHEKKCHFKPVSVECPVGKCRWGEYPESLVEHLHSSHGMIVNTGSSFALTCCMPPGANWIHILRCFGFYFVVTLRREGNCASPWFYFYVQIIGAKKQAQKFNYRAAVRGEESDVFSCVSKVRSIVDSGGTIMHHKGCLCLSKEQAAKFEKDGHLDILIEIQKK